MLCRKVVVIVLVCVLAIVRGMPHNGDGAQDTSSLPFIQFTNGGIRLNFAGYHAAAGLGGLLGGSRAGGGLHASAGTPWGAHAAAGLGGLLGGDNANAGGGLYARAGLGNGRSEVGAGLGGVLDGSGRSGTPAAGGLYAGATMGDQGIGVATGTGVGDSNVPSEPSATQTNQNPDTAKPSKGGNSHIQIISHAGKKPHKIKQALSESAGSTETPKHIEAASNKEIREIHSVQSTPKAEAGIFGALSIDPVPQPLLENVKFVGGAIQQVPPVPPLSTQVNEVVEIEKRPHRVRLVYPKWVVRKRLWGPRKQIIVESAAQAQETPDTNVRKITRRQAPIFPINGASQGSNNRPTQNGSNGSFFDDIFKIPISTLNAVNQFLNNNSS